MKLVGLTNRYGGRVAVQISWGKQLYFEAPEPPVDKILFLEFPGLTLPSDGGTAGRLGFYKVQDEMTRAIIAFLTERKQDDTSQEEAPTTAEGRRKKRRQINEIPADFWRLATLDDLLEVTNGTELRYVLTQHFSLEELRSFVQRRAPEATERLSEALTAPVGAERLAALEGVERFVDTVMVIGSIIPNTISQELDKARRMLDRERIRAAKLPAVSGPEDLALTRRIALLSELKHDDEVRNFLIKTAKAIKRVGLLAAEVTAFVHQVQKNKRVQEAAIWIPEFWQALEGRIELPATEKGITLDITNAREVEVEMDWAVFNAHRIGPIVSGRKALLVHSGDNKIVYYIRGERKLLFQVRSAPGGHLEKYDCTLTIAQAEGQQRLRRLILDVERIDALAHLDPDAALASVPSAQDLPAHHPIRRTVDTARADCRQARVLADLLIELHSGVDADIIRSLSRRR